MSRNGNRITNYYNVIEAWKDWVYVAAKLAAAGRQDLIVRYAPDEDWGWRKIDKSIGAVCKEMGWPEVWQMRKAAVAQ